MQTTIVDTFFKPNFHMLQLEFSVSIRISLLEQQERIFRMEPCHLLRLANATQSLAMPTNPPTLTVDCNGSALRNMDDAH